MHLLPVVAAALADAEDPNLQERAVELYALVASQILKSLSESARKTSAAETATTNE